MKQKDVFLASEGDAWFHRNNAARSARTFPDADEVLLEILRLPTPAPGATLLEIGFGEGSRLKWLKENTSYACHGIEPSARAVEHACTNGLKVVQGTADKLVYADRQFDIVVFGFCLYLCDRDDLFRIASEAHRVLKPESWLVISDFYSPVPTRREYHHRQELFSHKMDYCSLFAWHPAYTVFSHKVGRLIDATYTDESSDWVATSVLRRNDGSATAIK